jgi:hypothetical protein
MVNNYIIHWHGYNHKSGGVRALHILNEEINKRGFYSEIKNGNVDKDSIVIYPEVTAGNPAHATKTVHWLLNKKNIVTDGMLFAWETGMGEYPLLTVNIIEMDVWHPREKSGGVAYWVGKGIFDPSVIPDGAQEISRNNFPNRNELAEFIAGLDYLISFDPFTAVNVEAIVSNTPVIIHCDDRHQWSKEEIMSHEWIKYGVGWGTEELDLARSAVGIARDHYESLIKTFDTRIDNFIELTQNRW